MRFQPSAYSDVAATAPPAGASGADPSAAVAANIAQLGTRAAGMGLDAWQARSDARAEKWRKIAAKRAKKPKGFGAKSGQQAAVPTAPMLPAPLPPTAMNPMLKWGLIAAGVGIVGFALFMVLRKKEEPAKPKSNPKRVFIKAPAKPRVTNVRPASTEIPATIEIEENPADDDDGGGYAGDDGDDYGDAEESE